MKTVLSSLMASVTVMNRWESWHTSGIVVLQGGATQHTQGRSVMQLCGLCRQEKGVEAGREREQAFIDSVLEVRLQGLIPRIVTKEDEDRICSLIC